jgi:quinol monooxygenase YgiN
MIHVVAVLTAHPGKGSALVEAFRANLPAVRAERGCLEYVPTIDAADGFPFQTPAGPDTVVVVEKWADADALRAHAAAPHMVAFGARIRDIVASRAIHVLAAAD